MNELAGLLRHRIIALSELIDRHEGDELLVNGSSGVFVMLPSGQQIKIDFEYQVEEFVDFLIDLAESQYGRLDALHPSCGGSFDNLDLRWHAVLSPVAARSFVFSLRKHRFASLALCDFVILDSQRVDLEKAIEAKCPVLVCGKTGSGKTSFLVTLLKQYKQNERVVVVESLAEIPPIDAKWIRLSAVPDGVSGRGGYPLPLIAKDVVRLRPDVIALGEIRDGDFEVFLDLNQTGHGGCFSTIHAGSIADARMRFSTRSDLHHRTNNQKALFIAVSRQKDGRVAVKELGLLSLYT
jgi:pilus assembly protein CpaF